MAVFTYGSGNDYIDIYGEPLGQYETGHKVLAGGGNDTVYGSEYGDLLDGQSGNDWMYGDLGNDILVGGAGADTLYGGSGNDSLLSGDGNDHLVGDAGNEVMYGGTGDDIYYHYNGGGTDTINDDKSEAGNTGYGGGNDIIYFGSQNLANLGYAQPTGSNDLWLSTSADLSDGVVNDGVIIQDFFLGGDNVVEWLRSADGYWVDLTQLL